MIAGSEMYNCDKIKCECHNKSFFNSCAHADDRHYASCDTRLKPKPDWISVADNVKNILHANFGNDTYMWKHIEYAINEVCNPEPPKTRSEG